MKDCTLPPISLPSNLPSATWSAFLIGVLNAAKVGEGVAGLAFLDVAGSGGLTRAALPCRSRASSDYMR